MLRTKEEYLNLIARNVPCIYVLGNKVTEINSHPILRPVINTMGETFVLARRTEFQDPLVAHSPFTEGPVNRYNHVCWGVEDLIKRNKAARIFQNNVLSCAYRCAGCAAINALFDITYAMGEEGKPYHRRYLEYLRFIQNHDLAVTGGITDVKGDRGLRPSQQADPDMYVHVVEQRKDGIVVRGAKAHQSGAPVGDEILVIPTISLKQGDSNYAVAFAVPSNAAGITHVFQHNFYDSRRMVGEDIDLGNASFGYGYGTSLVIFEDVFVPWDRVFMCGEYEHTALMMDRLGRIIRMVSGACRGSQGDLFLGAAAVIAEYNGVGEEEHIKEKLTEISLLNESSFGCALAAAGEGIPTKSGAWYPDAKLANVSLYISKRAIYESSRLLADIAGGLAVTLPSAKDLQNPEVGALLKKYLRGRADVSTESRIRMMRFIEGAATGPLAAGLLHGAGAPEIQRKVIWATSDIEQKKKMARRLAGISDG